MKYIFIGLVILSFCSCAEDNLFGVDNSTAKSNAISFNVTTGIASNVNPRARLSDNSDSSNLLQPLVLKSAALSNPLYLHTYIAEESGAGTNEMATRAAQVNNVDDFVALNKTSGFHLKVYGVSDGNESTPQDAVAKPRSDNASENVWNTSPLYYWPADDRLLSFYAFAPASARSLLEGMTFDNTNKTISFDYEVPKGIEANEKDDAEVQSDIMFAIAECNKPASQDGKVPMNFRHALSAIKFAVRDVVGGTIKQISISGVSGKAHCIYTKTETSEGYEFVWSGHSEANTSYTQTFDYQTEDNTTEEDVVINTQMPEKTFLLIPQEIPSDAKIEVVFERKYDKKEFTMSGNIRDNEVTEWKPGKQYIYTISTSSSNWIYFFEVLGSEQTDNNDEPEFNDGDSILFKQPITQGAYYKVLSYRMRANDYENKESVAWKVDNISNGVTTKPDDFSFNIVTPDVSPDTWIPTKTMDGEGSVDFTRYDLVFYPQIAGTDYEGDWELQERTEWGTAESPVDLSTIYGSISTANCYVINAPGYFKFPLVYGNAIRNGEINPKSYTYEIPGNYSSLTSFVDYRGKAITGPKIIGAEDAVLVWEDAYNLISDIRLNSGDGEYGSVSFKVNKENLQQGNAVIAIRDENEKIMWSWHIWITEHWAPEGSLQLMDDNIAIPTYDNGLIPGNKFYAAPRNLGWCDPKSVWYLKRTGMISFEQEVSGKTASLPIEQREVKIEYWIGNNTYYQFGRKDPMVGFMNSSSVVKYNFGPYPYQLEPQPKRIQDGIQKPNVLFVGGVPHNSKGDGYDWLSVHYQNLWNNTDNLTTAQPSADNKFKYHYSGIKTVYDPCPVGYMVPPVGFFKYITWAKDEDSSTSGLDFNGELGKDDRGQTIYIVKTGGDPLILYGTGHRWYANTGDVPPGGNFNPEIAYLWSSQIVFSGKGNNAYGLALGGKDNTSNFRFIGRRAMARPVRPVKELE